jgi:hypothetical protein
MTENGKEQNLMAPAMDDDFGDTPTKFFVRDQRKSSFSFHLVDELPHQVYTS